MSDDFRDELKKMKEDMEKMKKQLADQAKEMKEETINIGKEAKKNKNRRNIRVEFDDKDFEFADDIDDTLGSYFGSIMEGVAQTLSSSMKQMATGFQFNLDGVKEELERNKGHIERAVREKERELERAARKAERAADKMERQLNRQNARIFRFHKLSEEELDQFYAQAPNLTSALSDEKKLRLLKELEKGPQYQKELSETTDIKGGTFKHHMDSLLEMKYVQQEAARGRYMITQFGVEALKLSEMLFRRYIFLTNEDATEREVEVEFEDDLDDVNGDIASDAEAVHDLSQNDEEEG